VWRHTPQRIGTSSGPSSKEDAPPTGGGCGVQIPPVHFGYFGERSVVGRSDARGNSPRSTRHLWM
jgi:hypothetical protein